jgi:hypothetical protein
MSKQLLDSDGSRGVSHAGEEFADGVGQIQPTQVPQTQDRDSRETLGDRSHIELRLLRYRHRMSGITPSDRAIEQDHPITRHEHLSGESGDSLCRQLLVESFLYG